MGLSNFVLSVILSLVLTPIGLLMIPCSLKVFIRSLLVILGVICFSTNLRSSASTIGCKGFLPSFMDFFTSITHLSNLDFSDLEYESLSLPSKPKEVVQTAQGFFSFFSSTFSDSSIPSWYIPGVFPGLTPKPSFVSGPT